MRKPILFVTAVAAFSIMVMSAVSLAMSYSSDTPQTVPPEAVQAPVEALPEVLPESADADSDMPPDDNFLLREHDGVIVVCRPETPDIPEQITDIQVAALRLADQKSLEQGIPVTGQENLLRLLEDFCP